MDGLLEHVGIGSAGTSTPNGTYTGTTWIAAGNVLKGETLPLDRAWQEISSSRASTRASDKRGQTRPWSVMAAADHIRYFCSAQSQLARLGGPIRRGGLAMDRGRPTDEAAALPCLADGPIGREDAMERRLRSRTNVRGLYLPSSWKTRVIPALSNRG